MAGFSFEQLCSEYDYDDAVASYLQRYAEDLVDGAVESSGKESINLELLNTQLIELATQIFSSGASIDDDIIKECSFSVLENLLSAKQAGQIQENISDKFSEQQAETFEAENVGDETVAKQNGASVKATKAREQRKSKREARRAKARSKLAAKAAGLEVEEDFVQAELNSMQQKEQEAATALKNEEALPKEGMPTPKLLSAPMVLEQSVEVNSRNDWVSFTGNQEVDFSISKLVGKEEAKRQEEIKKKGEDKKAKKERKQMKKDEVREKHEAKLNNLVSECNVQVLHASSETSAGSSHSVCLNLEGLSMDYGGKVKLLEDASLRLVTGRKYGVVGRNGCGKSTMLQYIPNLAPKGLSILHVAQEAEGSDTVSVLDYVLNTDQERMSLLKQERELLKVINRENSLEAQKHFKGNIDDLVEELTAIQVKLNQIGAQAAEGNAASILSGLQFTQEMQKACTNSLSGGWRMRLALAGALFMKPDLLLLDEPTNHLDLHAVIWLENYLKTEWNSSLLVVAHDRAFLDNVTTDILHLDHSSHKLIHYKGNYETFIETRRQRYQAQLRAYTKQQEEIAHMQAFVDKWLHNKFGYNRGLVQSRIKFIERKKNEEKIDKPLPPDGDAHFAIPEPQDVVASPYLQVKDCSFRYPGMPSTIFSKVNLKLGAGDKAAVVGANGAGKSTLLKLITGELMPNDGAVVLKGKMRMGIFSQHFVEQLDLNKCALEDMRLLLGPEPSEQELRRRLGAFGITDILATKKMNLLSGGQKSRVALAKMVVDEPHLLVLDEPTNHLDIESVNGLISGLKNFQGAVVIVSHDSRLIANVCNQLFHADGAGSIEQMYCSFEEYRAKISDELK